MTASRAVTTAVVALVAGTLLAACDSATAGSPVPQSSPRSSQETTEPGERPPPVRNPRNLRGVDPCQLLTPQQLTELTFGTPGKPDVSPWGEGTCVWQNANLSIALAPDTRRTGLAGTYQRRDNFDNFETSTVDGYPAVRVNAATQICTVVVGLADDQALLVDFGRVTGEDPAYDDPCGFTEKVADMVLDNLSAG